MSDGAINVTLSQHEAEIVCAGLNRLARALGELAKVAPNEQTEKRLAETRAIARRVKVAMFRQIEGKGA